MVDPATTAAAGVPAAADGSFEELARGLVDVLGARAGYIAIWHPERGQVGPAAGAGLPPAALAALDALLTAAAPDLLFTLTGTRPVAVRVGTLPGWELDLDAGEARRTTGWGRLHVLAAPVSALPRPPEGPATPAAGAASRAPLTVLLALIHTAPRLNLRGTRPHVLRLLVRQIELELQTRRLVAALADEARWLEAVLGRAGDGVVLVDTAGRIAGCNAGVGRITGWSAADLYGRDLVQVLHARPVHWNGNGPPGEDDLWAGPIAAAEETTAVDAAAESRPLALVLVGRQGNQVYSEATVAPVRGSAGHLLGAVVSLHDVTAAREAEELQATFLSVISHELQTPLAVIRGYAELVAEQAERMPAAKLRRNLAVVAEESERLSKMVRDLLDASRIQAGGLELHRDPVHIPRLVRRAVQKVELLTTRHQFLVVVPDDLPPVLADDDRIEQVLINLLDNAVKYSPNGGRITVTADLSSDEVIVHVSDEGVGVPEAERERIFSRFARLDSRVVRQMKGVGLGLYIARAIITAHGGRIWVHPAPGGGAEFSFSLPREQKAPLPVLFGRV